MSKNVQIENLSNLLEIQRSSFCWFLSTGLAAELNKFSHIYLLEKNTDNTVPTKEVLERFGKKETSIELKVCGHNYKLGRPKLLPSKAKEKTATYSVKLYIQIEIIQKTQSFVDTLLQTSVNLLERQMFLVGEIPLMTDKGTFIVNGCERVIVNQLIRSPGVYYKKEKRHTKQFNIEQSSAKILTKRGSWLTFELISKTAKDATSKFPPSNLMWVKVDKKEKIPMNFFLAALELSNQEIYQQTKNSKFLFSCLLQMKEEIEHLLEKKTPNAILDSTKARQLLYSRVLKSSSYDLSEVGRLKLNKKLGLNLPLSLTKLSSQDILKTIDYLIDVKFDNGEVDDIDSLINRRVCCVGELIQAQINLGLTRMRRNINDKTTNFREKLSGSSVDSLRIIAFVNSKPLNAVINEFFGSSQLSQYMDEINPLAELTHKRRISALGPGGLNTAHVSKQVRDIHPTQYGRLCPIETPEGQTAGLIASLASHARLNKYGFIETPFFHIFQEKVVKNFRPLYLSAEKEKQYKIAPADMRLTTRETFENSLIPIRYNQEFTLALPSEIDLVAISPIQIISAAAGLIPFLEHDDANRALMGSNMQRQAVALLCPQKPIVGTGLESQIVTNSYPDLVNFVDGVVTYVSGRQIVVQPSKQRRKKRKKEEDLKIVKPCKRYKLEKYRRSNQNTCINQKPIVWPGEFVCTGQVLADGPGTHSGELALGQNLTVAYMPWEGYNYEDAILVSERLVYLDLFTSIHIEGYEVKLKQTKQGLEEMTTEIPNASERSLRHLDPNGRVQKGAFVQPGDVLVGKVTPKGESDLLPEAKLLKAIFGQKTVDVRDTSLVVPKGVHGRVIDVLEYSKYTGDDLPTGVVGLIKVYVAQFRKIKVGDKMAGRHGNKGIISKILPIQDMPYLPDGTIVDLLLNPLGVPSRMNVGQLFESLLGFAGDQLNKRFKILPFDEMYSTEASRILVNTKLKEAALAQNKPWIFNPYCPGKIKLIDGQTGIPFENPILVGKSYILKLNHLVDNKMHARATGPYSLVTQQPVRGKARHGGQRFGEMEVWALEAFGSAYTLRELLTLKSDDMEGRNAVFNAIVNGQAFPKSGIPESFKVLINELQALGLDIRTYKIKKASLEHSKAIEVNLTHSSKNIQIMENL
jgi:DNA-directed RNA polymerase subunit beta